VLTELRELVGSVSEAPRFNEVRPLTASDIIERPGQSLHQALSELPRAVCCGSSELHRPADPALPAYERLWQRAATAAVGLEGYVEAVGRLPDKVAWDVLRDLADLSGALLYLDRDLSQAVLPRVKVGEDLGVAYRVLTSSGHDALRLAAGELRARVPVHDYRSAPATPLLASHEPAGAGDLDRQTSRFVRIVAAHSAELAMPDLRAISRVLEHGCADAARVLLRAGEATHGANHLARTLATVIPAALELRELPGRSTAHPHLALHAAAADLQARMEAMAQQAHSQPIGAYEAERRRLSAASLEFVRHVPVLAQAVEVAIRESIHAGVLLVPNQTTEGKTSMAWVTGRMAPRQGVPALQRAARKLSKVATDVGPAVRTTQLSLDQHRAAVPDGRSQAVASAVSHAAAARAQLREALTYRLSDQPAALAGPLPAHPRLAPGLRWPSRWGQREPGH